MKFDWLTRKFDLSFVFHSLILLVDALPICLASVDSQHTSMGQVGAPF